MAKSITAKGQKMIHYIAKFLPRGKWEGLPPSIVRDLHAVNDYQARMIAEGLARRNGWLMVSVGRK